MKPALFFLLATAVVAGACSNESTSQPPSGDDVSAVGSDRDAHGCITSAGYRWCAKENECLRPWELAEEIGLDSSPEAFDDYCRNEAE